MNDPGLRAPRARPRRPLVALALALAAGLPAGFRLGPVEAWGAAAALALVAAGLLRRYRRGAEACLAAVLLLGGFHAAVQRPGLSARSPERMLERPRETVELVGLVIDDPAVRLGGVGVRTRRSFTVRVESIHRTADGWQRCRARVQVRCYGPWPEDRPAPRYGDRVLLAGVLPREAPHRMTVRPVAVTVLSRGHGSAFIAAAYRAREAARRRLARGLETAPEASAVLQAMLIGQREELTGELRGTFRATGTVHILAISGLHVGAAVGLLLLLARVLGVPAPWRFPLLAPVLLAAMVMTGLPASAVRATLMALVYLAAPTFRRRPDAPSAVAAAAVLILAARPEAIFDLGFIFSFVMVAGLIAFEAARAPAPAVWTPDPETRGRALLAALRRRGLQAIRVTALAWIIAAPLTARYANVVAPIGLVANLLVAPAAFAVVGFGGLGLLLDASFPAAGEALLAAARGTVNLLIAALARLAAVPGGHVYVRAPPLAALPAAYAVMAALIRGRGRVRRAAAGVAAAAALLGLVALALPGPMRVEMPGAAAGCGPLVRLPGGTRLLLDPGPAFRAGSVERHLRGRGVNRLHALVLTRADAPHMGGALALARRIPVDEVWYPDFPARSPVFRAALAEFEAAGLRLRPMSAGQRLTLPGGAEWDVLHPPAGTRAIRADANELVARVGLGPLAVVFAGSASAETAERIGALPVDAAAPVLAVRAPPEDFESWRAWLDLVRPARAVVPDDPDAPWRAEALAETTAAAGARHHVVPPDGRVAVRPVTPLPGLGSRAPTSVQALEARGR